MEQKRCGQCGANIPGSATFCPRCGSVTPPVSAAPEDRYAPPGDYAPAGQLIYTPVGADALPWYRRTAQIVLLVLAAGVVFLILFGILRAQMMPRVRTATPAPAAVRAVVPAPPVLTERPALPALPTTPTPPRPSRSPDVVERLPSLDYYIPAFEAPALRGGRVSIPFPEPIATYRVGGGGRYHSCYLRRAGKIAVVDVSAAAVVHEIPVGSSVTHFAAGAKHLVVLDPAKPQLRRYSLDTFQQDDVGPLPGDVPLRDMRMAPNDHEKLYLIYDHATDAYSVTEMESHVGPNRTALSNAHPDLRGLRLSFDGQLGVAGPRHFALYGGRRTLVGLADAPADRADTGQPTADGALVLNGNRLTARDGRPIDARLGDGPCVPSTDARFFWRLSGSTGTLYTTADRHLVHTYPRLPVVTEAAPHQFPYRDGTPTFWHLPQAKALVFAMADRVVIQRFDLLEEFAKIGTNYLYVQSLPQHWVNRGGRYTYRIDVVSKAGGVKLRLVTGPAGMNIDPTTSLLHWPVPKRFEGDRVPVVVAVSDASGQEIEHRFELPLP